MDQQLDQSLVADLSIQQVLSILQEKVNEEISRSHLPLGAPAPTNGAYTTVIENLEQSITLITAQAHTTRNATQPFNLLPPHIITHVSSFLLPDYLLLLKASGLCRNWRRILVSSPVLWTWIEGSPPLVDLCLARSSSLSLRVVLSGDVPPQTLTSLKSHLPRVRSLRICLPPSKIHSVLDELSVPSPILRSLDVEIPLSDSGKPSTMPENLSKQWSTQHFPPILSENSMLTELCLRYIPLNPTFMNLSSVTTAILHHSDWSIGHILKFISANQALERLSVSGRISKPEPLHPTISLPHLKLFVLSNTDPNYLLCHLKVPLGTHLEFNCCTTFPSSNCSLENLSRLEDWCFSHNRIAGVENKILTGIGPSGSVRVKSAKNPVQWENFYFTRFSFTRVRKLRFYNVVTDHLECEELGRLLGAMNRLETIIIDGDCNFKLLCHPLTKREPTPLCPSLHTFVCGASWDRYVFFTLESIVKCRYEAPEIPALKRLIIATNGDLPEAEELRELRFHVDSLELRMTSQVPETWNELSSEWGGVPWSAMTRPF